MERAKRGRDRGSDPNDALFQIWPKKRNPEFAAKKQLWAAHRGWAPRTRRAIVLHLLHRRCCIMPDVTAAGGMTAFVHLRLTTRELARLDLKFFSYSSVSARSDFNL